MTDRIGRPDSGPSGVEDEVTATSDGRALRRILGLGGLVAFGLAYLVPLTVFTTFGAVTRITAGHLPLAYLVTTAAMVFTAISYALSVRASPSAGSAYAYTKAAFGERLGFVTGWTLLLDYLLLPSINYLIVGIYLHAQFPEVPAAAFVLAAIALVTVLNIIGIDVVRTISLVLVAGQLLFAVVFVSLAFARADAGASLMAPFHSPELAWPAIFAGAAVLCLSFLGFDAVSTLSEEAREPRRTVPRAILLTTLGGGFIFVMLSWASALVLPDWRSIEVSDSAGIEVMAPLGGPVLVAVFLAAYISGCLASAVASQASVSRILYAMGRDGVLPGRLFGVLSARYRTPVGAILVVALVSLVSLVVSLDALASVISFGALFAFSLVNLSVVKRFAIDDRRRTGRDLLLFGGLPVIGFALTAWLWASLSLHAMIVGLAWMTTGILYQWSRAGRDRASVTSLDV